MQPTWATAESAVRAQFCPIAADSANWKDRQSDSVKTIAQWSNNKTSILIMFWGKGFKSCGFMHMEKKWITKAQLFFFFFLVCMNI